MNALCLALFLAPQGAPEKPEEVMVGIYINQITKLSLKENCFTVDFWIWFRWKNDELKPYETWEIVNGQVEKKPDKPDEMKKLGDVNYATMRVVATIVKFWDISKFPLDSHSMEILIEDTAREEHRLVFVPDTENSNYDPDVQVAGWAMGKCKATVGTSVHRTNYGDTSLPTGKEARYSSFSFSLRLERQGYHYFIKLFVGLLVAVLIGFLALFIKPTDLDPRFGLGVGAIFAAVASNYVIASTLPDSNQMCLADQLHNIGFAVIFLTLLESTLSLRLFTSGREAMSKRLDRWSAFLLGIAYFGSSVWLVVRT